MSPSESKPDLMNMQWILFTIISTTFFTMFQKNIITTEGDFQSKVLTALFTEGLFFIY